MTIEEVIKKAEKEFEEIPRRVWSAVPNADPEVLNKVLEFGARSIFNVLVDDYYETFDKKWGEGK